jgi:hypothetical protein
MDYRKKYLLAFDEINALTEASFKLSSKDPKKVADDMLSFLINAYTLGNANCNEMLKSSAAINTNLMREAVYKNIAGKTFEDRVKDHMEEDDLIGLVILAESEFHRVYNAGAEDTARTVASTVDSGTGERPVIYKEWLTKLDDRVRNTHDYLEGARVPLGEDFYSYDGDHAPYPGSFEKAENNVNCRCIVAYGRDA